MYKRRRPSERCHLPGSGFIQPSSTGHSVEGTSTKETPEVRQRNRIAKRAAQELKEGYYVNLGVGIPTLATSFLPEGRTVWVQSENGILGMGPYPTEEEVDAYVYLFFFHSVLTLLTTPTPI